MIIFQTCDSLITLFEKISNQAFSDTGAIITPNDVYEYALINAMISWDEYVEPYDCIVEFDYILNSHAIEIAEEFAPSLVYEIERNATDYVKVTGHRPLF